MSGIVLITFGVLTHLILNTTLIGIGMQPTLPFLPGKFHGQGILLATVHGVAESLTTEHLHTQL